MIISIIPQAQACFTPAFEKVWGSYAAQAELQEEYGLYQKFLIDRCQKLSRMWGVKVLANLISFPTLFRNLADSP
jgi:hypothetical protein